MDNRMNKCFRCGFFDDAEGVWVCRYHGDKIDKPFEEVCDKLLQLDSHVDLLNSESASYSSNLREAMEFVNDCAVSHVESRYKHRARILQSKLGEK